MGETTSIFKEVMDRLIPKKYQGIITIVAIVVLLSVTVTNCFHSSNDSMREIREELKKMNNHLEILDKRVNKLEVKLVSIDSTTTLIGYDVIVIKASQKDQFDDICNILNRSVEVMGEELIDLHQPQHSYLTTRFKDLNSYIKSIISKDTQNYKIYLRKTK